MCDPLGPLTWLSTSPDTAVVDWNYFQHDANGRYPNSETGRQSMRSAVHFWSGSATAGAGLVCLWLWVVADTDAVVRNAIIFTALTVIAASVWLFSRSRSSTDPDPDPDQRIPAGN
ncbi:MAG TPA: hypothetical protein VGP24_02500 [Glaciihabitans sp.]|nr:hypothetical protein [Glaciihabitans sp.]